MNFLKKTQEIFTPEFFFIYFIIKYIINMKQYRYTIITCNFGNYEIMREVVNPLDDVEYLYVTDDNSVTSKTWNIIYDKSYDEYTEPFDKVIMFRSRVLEYCHSPLCIRIDGSIGIHGNSFEETVNEMNKNGNDISFIISPRFHTYENEMYAWENQRGVESIKILEFANYCKHKGFKYSTNKNSICTLTILLQRNNEINERLNNKQIEVLKEIKEYNNSKNFYRIDQIVFTYVLNEFFNDINVLPLHYDIISNQLTQIYFHNTNDLLYDYSVSMEKRLYLFGKIIKKLFNGNTYNELLTKEDIISKSKKIHLNLCKDFYSDTHRYQTIVDSYKEWCDREDVLVCNLQEGYFFNTNSYERYLINENYYNILLPKICESLNIDFNVSYFNMFEYMALKQYIPKNIIDNICFYPKTVKYEDSDNYKIMYDITNSLLYENTLTLTNFKDVEPNISDISNIYTSQFKFSLNSFKIQQNRLSFNGARNLLVITDGTILPFINILNYYFYTIVVINNSLENVNYEFLYAYNNITDILILTSTNKSLELIIDNL